MRGAGTPALRRIDDTKRYNGMSFGVGVLLALIGYFVLKAGWRIYKVVEIDRPDRDDGPSPEQTYRDEFGEEYEVEDARWRDLP